VNTWRKFFVILILIFFTTVRDSKKDNQIEQDKGKDEASLGSEDETKNTLYPAPPFTTFRSTLQVGPLHVPTCLRKVLVPARPPPGPGGLETF